MTDETKPPIGSISWADLTVDDADRVRDFYVSVTGWTPEPLSMGQYNDYVMKSADGTPVGGVCHARGSNAGAPPLWLVYIVVPDLDQSVERCLALGGELVMPIKNMGGQGRYCVFRDPAGAVAALYQSS